MSKKNMLKRNAFLSGQDGETEVLITLLISITVAKYIIETIKREKMSPQLKLLMGQPLQIILKLSHTLID